ncbi:hypothetical protein EG831_03735, partial [bacterium]|nr:hypothetical protein [bacterium]
MRRATALPLERLWLTAPDKATRPYQLLSRIAEVRALTGQWPLVEEIHRGNLEWARAAAGPAVLADALLMMGGFHLRRG